MTGNLSLTGILMLFVLTALAACGGGRGETSPRPTFAIGGNISGLTGTVVLQNNHADDLSRSADGAFAFATFTSAYNVTVLTQPAGQTCTVTNGTGTATATVTSAAVNCASTTPLGMCTDIGTGQLRAVVKPTAAQLVINEWMPDPALVGDTNGEWFELRASAAFDLNGLQAGTTTLGAAPLIPVGGNCVPIAAGGFALFARTSSAATNGMLPSVDATFSFNLVQSNGTLQIGLDGTALDTKTWTASTSALSHMIDTDGTQCVAPAGVAQYNGTDVGTPRATNTPPECP